ncbi:MAG TPA: tellurium resistance protein TerC, partial [Hellea balneolensis]|nr:tellurium resistance protein TerC [Hellea balneolensis]
MADLLTVESLFTLLMLILLQAVLGFDNLLYIAIESNKVAKEDASKVRKLGIGIAVIFRILLLILIVKLFALLQGSLFTIPFAGIIEGHFTLQSLVTLIGGGFIIYTAIKEITHMLTVDHIDETQGGARNSVFKAVFVIVLMNLVFSFDSILSAMAIASTQDA